MSEVEVMEPAPVHSSEARYSTVASLRKGSVLLFLISLVVAVIGGFLFTTFFVFAPEKGILNWLAASAGIWLLWRAKNFLRPSELSSALAIRGVNFKCPKCGRDNSLYSRQIDYPCPSCKTTNSRSGEGETWDNFWHHWELSECRACKIQLPRPTKFAYVCDGCKSDITLDDPIFF